MPKYRFEYNGNPEYVTLHVTERLLDADGFVSRLCSEGITSPISELLNLLNGCDGVEDANIRPYSITAKRGTAFERDEVLNALLEVFKIWFKVQGIETLGWTQLPTLRSDISAVQCTGCRKEQQQEMRRTMRDFDTLEF